MSTANLNNIVYIFIDESGEFNFSQGGSRYFILSAMTTTKPFELCPLFHDLKHKLNLAGDDMECFHASEDLQSTRDGVYEILRQGDYFVDAITVEKAKTNPVLREPVKLYQRLFGCLFQYIYFRYKDMEISKILIYVSEIKTGARKEAYLKGIKTSLEKYYKHHVPYQILMHSPQSNFYLQAVDYCCWAIKKKHGDWNKPSDLRPYNCIASKVISDFDIFATGDCLYY